jgi:DNA modification methylase/ParB-like chromosome segregation protein Spo0J
MAVMLPEPVTIRVKFEEIDFGDRRREQYDDIEKLAADINANKLFHNLVCDRGENGKPYHLLAGGRRYCALELLGWTELEIKYYDAVLTPNQRRIVELHENIFRQDLTWQEEDALRAEIHALSIAEHGEKTSTAKDAPGWSIRQTAELMKEDPATISRSLKLAQAAAIIPEIAQAKSRNDAMKLLNKREQAIVTAEIVRRLEEEQLSTPLDVSRRQLSDCYIVRDFFAGVKDIPDKSINLVEIDPPYGIDLVKIKMESDVVDGYNEVSCSEYPDFIERVIVESIRVMADDAWLVMWYGAHKWTTVVYELLIKHGLQVSMHPAIWEKSGGQAFGLGNTMNPSTTLASTYEPFYYARKGNAKLQKMGRSNVFSYRPVKTDKKIHPTERPLSLIEDILETFACPGHRVLVPFSGSGKTLLAASNKRMQPIGYDLSKEYKDKFVVKVFEGEPGRFVE